MLMFLRAKMLAPIFTWLLEVVCLVYIPMNLHLIQLHQERPEAGVHELRLEDSSDLFEYESLDFANVL